MTDNTFRFIGYGGRFNNVGYVIEGNKLERFGGGYLKVLKGSERISNIKSIEYKWTPFIFGITTLLVIIFLLYVIGTRLISHEELSAAVLFLIAFLLLEIVLIIPDRLIVRRLIVTMKDGTKWKNTCMFSGSSAKNLLIRVREVNPNIESNLKV